MRPSRQGTVACLFLVLSLLGSGEAQAVFSETWFKDSEPSWTQIERWKTQLSEKKKLRLRIDGSPSIELLPKLQAARFSQVQILTPAYPSSSSVDRWKELAQAGVELVTMAGTLPTDSQVHTLNEIRFPRILFLLSNYIDYRQKNPFLRMETRFDLHFVLNRYPQYMQKFAIADLPPEVDVQITVDYWPRYIQMDVLNLIPQMKQLRIQSTPLSSGALEYVNHLKNIREVIFESDFEPPQSQWSDLMGVPVRWMLKNRTPSESALALISSLVRQDGMRFRLSLDLSQAAKAEEKAIYEALPFDVEWTSDAP